MTVVINTPATSRPNPQKKNILIRRLSRAPWWLLMIAVLMVLFVLAFGSAYPYPIVWRAVREGVKTTIWVSVVAYALAMVMALIVALLRRSSNVVIYQLSTLYVEAVRGVPTLVLVYYLALAGIPWAIGRISALGEWLYWLRITVVLLDGLDFTLTFNGVGGRLKDLAVSDFPNVYRAILALAISYSAFLSEVFRAGIDSIDVGQREAANSLGMTRWQTMRLVILPQAIRVVIPPLANDFIAMLKESSLVSVLGVGDITRRGQTYSASSFRIFAGWNVIALTYLVLTLTLSMLVKLLETYLHRGQQRD